MMAQKPLTEPIKQDMAYFEHEFLQLCMLKDPYKINTAKTKQ